MSRMNITRNVLVLGATQSLRTVALASLSDHGYAVVQPAAKKIELGGFKSVKKPGKAQWKNERTDKKY